jgi:hypothetical protein
MKKQEEKQELIDWDHFQDEMSLWKMVPPGTNKGTGLSLLKTYIDSVLHSHGVLKSLLLVGKSKMQLELTATAFLRSLGGDNINMSDAVLVHSIHELYIFLCGRNYDGYILTDIENMFTSIQSLFINVLKNQQLSPYNYTEQQHDTFDINSPIVMLTTHLKKVPSSITDRIQHIALLEEYTEDELLLVVLYYLKWAKIGYANEHLLQNIVKFGNSKFDKCFQLLRICIAVMQADSENTLMQKHVARAVRLNRLTRIEMEANSHI